MEQLVKALLVMVTDFNLRAHLEANDPQALKQALRALRAGNIPCPDGYKAARGEKAFWTVEALKTTV